MKKIVLGFSGGLDTTFCARYLSTFPDAEVHTITVNTGGFNDEELHLITERARNAGAVSHVNIDARQFYFDSIIKNLIFGNVLKNGTYPLSVSAERLCQALEIARYAKSIGANAIAHGSTGAGNDQVRFDLIFNIYAPEMEIMTPVRDHQFSREQEIDYLQNQGIHLDFTKAAYSINKGLWGTSVGGRETLRSLGQLPEEAWPTQITKHQPEEISITFQEGIPVAINDQYYDPVSLIEKLRDIAAPFGIGRDIHVGDTIIGIKGRVGFEAAAPLLLIKSHHLLEKHILTKWQLQWKDHLASFYGNWLHEGQILEPVMRDIEAFFLSAQKYITGKVYIMLQPHHFILKGIESDYDLMQPHFGSYGEMNHGWTGADVRGFTKIFGNQSYIYMQVHENDKY